MRGGSFNRENNELAMKVLEQAAQLAQANAQIAEANFRIALKDQVIDDLTSKLDERRNSPPPSRKRDREEGEVVREHDTDDIYIDGWNKAGIIFDDFKEMLKENYGIEALRISGVGKNQSFSRLHMKSNDDQKAFLYNVDKIREDFGLKGTIKIFREKSRRDF
jgi:uncharacterized coiled-coil protein SlyX